MKDIINGFTERFRREHIRTRRYVAMMLVLALLTTLFVNWQLHGVGISMTADYHCGYEEHQHTEACYEKVLTCGYEEGEPETAADTANTADTVAAYSVEEEPEATEPETILVPHTHTDECYEERQVLTCFKEEHEHDDDCFDEYGALICEKFEHEHDDSCYTTEYELVCGLDEGELVEEENPAYIAPVSSRPVVIDWPAETDPDEPVLHHHTDACYTEELVCTIPEHHHTVECLADEQTDVETAEEWQAAANVTLTGSWAEDLLTVAKSQLDYQQSEKNFKLDVEDQQVLRGYSRYGAWYGNPYGAWDVMFLSYCLHFAGVPQSVVPQRAGVLALHSELRGSQWLTDADGTTAKPGDIVIYNTLTTEQVTAEDPYGIALLSLNGEEEAAQTAASEPQIETRTVSTETVGVVSTVNPENATLTVISGNVDGKVAEVSLSTADVTSVISVNGAYAAEGSAEKDEDAAEKETDAAYDKSADTDGFGATVEWTGEAAEADPYGIALLAASVDDHDLNKWITNVSYKKYDKKNDQWNDIGADNVTVDSGDTIQVNLKYTVDAGVLTPENNQLTYQLPGGLPLPKEQEGNIVDETNQNAVIGSYTIDTNGKVTLTFTDKKFIGSDTTTGAAFTGTFHFSCAVSADSINEDKEIHFKDDCTLTIKKLVPDASLNKKGQDDQALIETLDDGTLRVNYQVTVASANSTNDNPVTIKDRLNHNNTKRDGTTLEASYEEGSIKLWLVDADGSAQDITSQYENKKTLQNDGSEETLTYTELPALKKGQTYRVTYSILVPESAFHELDGTGYVLNRAEMTVPNVKTDGYDSYITMNRRLTKEGEYDAETGRIKWKITLRVPNKSVSASVMNGFRITDQLPEGVDIVGDVTIEGKNGNDTISAEEFKKNGYKVDSSEMKSDTSKGAYLVIRFETTTPVGGGDVTNTATASKGNISFSGSDTVTIGKGDWTLHKKLTASGKTPTWDISATNKAGEKTFTLWDVLSDAESDAGDVQKDTHYAYAVELDRAIKEGLALTMHDNSKLSCQQAVDAGNKIEITYYSDAAGTEVVDAGDRETKVRSFKIEVTAASADNPVRGIAVTGIPTHEERSSVPAGEVWTYKNTIHIQGVDGTASAEDKYRNYSQFEKMVAAKSSGNEFIYELGNQSYEKKDLSGHKLHYQLVLQTSADDTAEITVTDTLPENVIFKADSVQISVDGRDFVKATDKKTDWADASYENAARLLTIQIRNYNKDNAEHKILIQYEADVGKDDELAWQDPAVSKVTYTNTASWGKLTSSTSTTLTRKVDEVKKTGEQLTDGKGNPTNRVRYQVVINPAREDLSALKNKDEYIELWDDVSASNGAIVNGDRDSVKLYYYQYTEGVGVTLGDEVPRNMYRILDTDNKGWLHMQVPNMAALILVYGCEVKQGNAANNYNVSNTVTLSSGATDKSDNIKFTAKSDATASTGQFLLRKVDSYSGVSLKGAQFTIYQYNKKDKVWTLWTGSADGTVTTDDKGQVSLTVLADGTDCLKPDVLYKIVETSAPDDYRLDSTPHYVLFRGSAETEKDAFVAATGETTKLSIGTETVALNRNVQVGMEGRTTEAEYGNVYSKLTISKLWLDQDTKQPVAPAVDSIHIKVWQYTDNEESKTLFKEATLNESNKWTASWSGEELPLKDGQENEYHYLVEEVTTGNWTVFIDNNGVQTGNITIQNRVYTGYELPSTGGMGTAPFGVLGGAMAAAAALLLARKRKHHAEEEE